MDAAAVAGAGIVALGFVATVTLVASRFATGPDPGQPTKRKWLLPVLKDSDGWPSLARFQLFLWTAVVGFGVLWVSITRLMSGSGIIMPDVPVNLLAILGIGTLSAPVSMYLSTEVYGRKAARDASAAEKVHMDHWHSMLMERDHGGEHQPSLTRLQMFLWTWTGVLIYLLTLGGVMFSAQTLSTPTSLSLPDLATVFVGLMGISQVGYIGGKTAVKRPT